jgi:hypothetical protein
VSTAYRSLEQFIHLLFNSSTANKTALSRLSSYLVSTMYLASTRLLQLGAACTLYLLYLPVLTLTVFRLLSNRQLSIIVFSGGNLKVLPLRSWLRTTLVVLVFLMFMFETFDIILDRARYLEVEKLPAGTKGQFSPIVHILDIYAVITEVWIKGEWCYATPDGTSYCGYERSVLTIADVRLCVLLECLLTLKIDADT